MAVGVGVSAIDRKSRELPVDDTVGNVVSVTFNGPSRPQRLKTNGLQPEPGCAEPCEWGLNSCLE